MRTLLIKKIYPFYISIVVTCFFTQKLSAQIDYKNVKADSIFTFKDERDGKHYDAIKVGNQIWMAENMNHKTKGSLCYNGKRKNCETFGRLYTWEAAQKACPKGWHLPSNTEWDILVTTLGGDKAAGNQFAFNPDLGFNLEWGYPLNINGRFGDLGTQTYFWSATENDKNTGFSYYMIKSKLPLVFEGYFSKNYNLNCRCIKDGSQAEIIE